MFSGNGFADLIGEGNLQATSKMEDSKQAKKKPPLNFFQDGFYFFTQLTFYSAAGEG